MLIEPVTVEGRRGFRATSEGAPPIFFAPVEPVDEWRLRLGVTELSPGSRYLRFFSPASELSEEQVYRFTHVDQVDHVAWGALDLSRPGNPGVAIGRMVRDVSEPKAAEIAVAVVDRVQHMGIGSALLATLFLMAGERNIRELRALVLPENGRVLAWFQRLGARVTCDEDACGVRLSLPWLQEADTDTARRLLMRMEIVRAALEAAGLSFPRRGGRA